MKEQSISMNTAIVAHAMGYEIKLPSQDEIAAFLKKEHNIEVSIVNHKKKGLISVIKDKNLDTTQEYKEPHFTEESDMFEDALTKGLKKIPEKS